MNDWKEILEQMPRELKYGFNNDPLVAASITDSIFHERTYTRALEALAVDLTVWRAREIDRQQKRYLEQAHAEEMSAKASGELEGGKTE